MASTLPKLQYNLKQNIIDATEKKGEIEDQLDIIQYLKNAARILYVIY